MNTYRLLNEKFQSGPVSIKTPYYSPWFFGILRRVKFCHKGLTTGHGLLVMTEKTLNNCFLLQIHIILLTHVHTFQ